MEITELTDDMTPGVQNTGRVTQQVDQSISTVKTQAKQAQVTTKSLFAGVKAAWKTFNRPSSRSRSNPDYYVDDLEPLEQLPASDRSVFEPEAELAGELSHPPIEPNVADNAYLDSEQFNHADPPSPTQKQRRQLLPKPDEIQRIEQ